MCVNVAIVKYNNYCNKDVSLCVSNQITILVIIATYILHLLTFKIFPPKMMSLPGAWRQCVTKFGTQVHYKNLLKVVTWIVWYNLYIYKTVYYFVQQIRKYKISDTELLNGNNLESYKKVNLANHKCKV